MDREPPANLDVECAVLGAILANNKALDLCYGLLPEHFHDPVNREIFRACKRRIEMGRTVDGMVLKGAFENTGLLNDRGGTAYLAHLLSCMVLINGVAEYSRVIIDCAVRRDLIAVNKEAMDRAYGTELADGDGKHTASWALNAIEQVLTDTGGKAGVGMDSAVDGALRQSEAAQRGEKHAIGLTTGVPSLDEMWAGLFPGNLDIIGARPKTGKTSLACQIARNVGRQCLAEGSGCVGFISLEMPAEHLGLVNLASLTGISADDIRRGRYDTKQAYALFLARQELAKLPIRINDQPRLPLGEACSWLRTLKRKEGLRLVIADHRNRFGRDENWMRATKLDWYGEITQRLKDTAKLLHVPILLLVQIGREADKREDPRPRMSDLEYAGEQDADNIVLLFRPELHTAEPPPKKDREAEEAYANRVAVWHQKRRELKGVADAIFAKRRFGPEGICRLRFDGPRTTFSDPPKERLAPIADLWSDET